MHIRSALIAASMFAALGLPAPAAEIRSNPSAVVELFTSQGCSSCPPADAALETLNKRADIIALAYHVDYWDYIGWKDTFGDHDNTSRQRAYARSWGSSSVYTPQLIVNGRSGVVASRNDEVKGALKNAALQLPVALSVADDMLNISIEGRAGGKEAMVWLVSFLDHANVAIERGENAGKTMSYAQIVTGRQVLGMWEPTSGTHLKLPLSEVLHGLSNGAVILVQEETSGLPGPILGAASFIR